MLIGFFGSGSGNPGDPLYDAMSEAGKLVVERNHVVMTGAYGGIGMEAPARGAHRVNNSQTVGFTMGGDRLANEFIDQVIDCSYATLQGNRKPTREETFGIRLGGLLAADAFIIGAQGGPGTMVEFFSIINFNSKAWKPGKRIAFLDPESSEPTESWAVPLIMLLAKFGLITSEVMDLVHVSMRPENAVDWVTGVLQIKK